LFAFTNCLKNAPLGNRAFLLSIVALLFIGVRKRLAEIKRFVIAALMQRDPFQWQHRPRHRHCAQLVEE